MTFHTAKAGLYFDAHAHLDELDNVSQALADAKSAGVVGVVAVSMNLSSCKKNLEIKKTFIETAAHPKIFIALGIHPSEIKQEETDTTIDLIEKNIDATVAIGEVGLDFWDKDAKKDENIRQGQKSVFEKMIGIALTHNKPLIIHSRGSWLECFEILKSNSVGSAVFHWYSGPLDVLNKILDAGYYISVTPALEYSKPLRAAAMAAPLDRILLETDTPVYGWRPADTLKSASYLAEIKCLPLDQIAGITTQNVKRFFLTG